MNKLLTTLALALCVSAPATAAQPSWCLSAKSLDEIVICHNEPLWKKDNLMRKRYDALRGMVRGKMRSDWYPRNQRAWLAERRQCGADVLCLAKLYEERLETLQEFQGDIEEID